MSGQKNYLASSFAIASVWFATHCGGGFATGNQEVNFYVKYGWTAFFLPFIAMMIGAWVYRNALVIAKDNNAHDYKSWANAFYHPYEKVFSVVFEICLIINILVAVSTSIAGAGALVNSTLGVPYFAAITCLGVLLLALTVFGSDLIVKVLSFKTYFLIVTLIILLALAFQQIDPAKLVRIFETKESFGANFGTALWSMVLYIGFQAFGMIPAVSVSHRITTTKECNYFGMFGVLLNGGFLLIVCIMLLGFTPDVLKETLPIYYVNIHLGYDWLKILYSVILFVGLVGTAVSFIFTTVARFEKAWEGKGIFASLRARRILISVVTMVICTGASTFGLTALVVKGYGFVGYLGLIFVVLPLLIAGTLKIKKSAELRRQRGIIEE